MSNVYLAEDTRLKKRWVVKEILKTVQGEDNLLSVQSALNEADMIKSLDHPAIVRIVAVAEDVRALYIVEDYVEGTALSVIAQQRRICAEDLFRWTEEICEVLGYLHHLTPPVIYRDLKPENLILTDRGHLKLVDFGIARRYKPGQKNDTVYLGTERFAAPEQYEDFGEQTDERTDIYGLGTTLKYLADFCEPKPQSLTELIRKCTAFNPADRYQTAEEVLRDLHILMAEQTYSGARPKVSLTRILLVVGACVCFCLVLYASVLRNDGGISEVDQMIARTGNMAQDGVFSMEEEEELLQTIMPDLSEWKEKEGFEELAYHIGTLYWYCYEYGGSGRPGQIAAAEWFHLADGMYDLASVYELLGCFFEMVRDEHLHQEGIYRSYADQILSLMEIIPKMEGADREKWELYQQFADIVVSFTDCFYKDGVTLGQMNHFQQLLAEDIEALKSGAGRNDYAAEGAGIVFAGSGEQESLADGMLDAVKTAIRREYGGFQ